MAELACAPIVAGHLADASKALADAQAALAAESLLTPLHDRVPADHPVRELFTATEGILERLRAYVGPTVVPAREHSRTSATVRFEVSGSRFDDLAAAAEQKLNGLGGRWNYELDIDTQIATGEGQVVGWDATVMGRRR